MRVLHINKYLWPKGGAEIYALRLAERQSQLGNSIAFFGGSENVSEKAIATNASVFTTASRDYHRITTFRGRIDAATSVLWSKRAASDLDEAVRLFQPEVAHLHNYAHQLTASILPVLWRRQIPIVATAHDYKLVCPAYTATRKGHDCFDCKRHVSPKLIRDACHHGDRAWSTVVAAESLITRTRRVYPSIILCPSLAMKQALAESWMSSCELRHVPNPLEDAQEEWSGGGYLLYVGRLSREKGIVQLLENARALNLPVVVAGDGPLRPEVDRLLAVMPPGSRLVGHVTSSDLTELRRHCRAQVIPSEWPENAPLSALEAAAMGVPIVVANRGGLPELLALGVAGALLEDTTPRALASALASLESNGSSNHSPPDLLSWSHHLDAVHLAYEDARKAS